MNKRETHIVTGMTRDLATSRFEPNFVYDAHNIRVRTVNGDSTLLSVTNEKGTEEFSLTEGSADIVGTILGTATFSDTLVLFTKDFETGREYIYKVVFNQDFTEATCTSLFGGVTPNVLNFQKDHPLETLALYENENIKKVYWVDGINQPRVINISTDTPYTNPDIFNFNREIGTDAIMTVTKFNSGGEFRPGTIQYCFNYYNKFGQETNIVDVSPLYYISPKDSGLAADDISGCSFQITFENLNTNFEYIRLYAIYRSSENATPSVRIVGDYSITDTETIVYDLNFEPVDGPLVAPDVEVPFDHLWVIDSNHNLIRLIYDSFAPEQGSVTHEIILNENEYLYDDRTDTAYCVYYLDRGGNTSLPKNPTIKIRTHAAAPFYYIINESDAINHRRLVGSPFIQRTINTGVSVIDTGVYGETLDAEALLFIGGQYIVAETLADKDNTLFLGNLRNVVPNIGDIVVTVDGVSTALKDLYGTQLSDVESCAFGFNGEELDSFEPETPIEDLENKDIVPYEKDNNRASTSIKAFKARENYRLGFIAQYKTGQWSEAVWLGDFTEEEQNGVNHFFPSTEYTIGANTYNLTLWGQQFRSAGFSAELSSAIADALLENGFIKVAPVVVYPQMSDRFVVCQGLLCPTVFNISDRVENAPYAQCDWRFRKGYSWNRIEEEIQANATHFVVDEAIPDVYPHNTYAPKVPFVNFRDSNTSVNYDSLKSTDFRKYFGTEYYRDPNIITFHSPDIDCSEELIKDDVTSLKLRLVGYTNGGFFSKVFPINPTQMTTKEIDLKSTVHYYIDMETPGFGSKSELLIKNDTRNTPSVYYDVWYEASQNIFYHYEYTEFFGGPLKTVGYKDNAVGTQDGKPYTTNKDAYYGWFTYLWHRNGSLNSQEALANTDEALFRTALYRRKVTSEKSFGFTTYFNKPNTQGNPLIPIEVPTKDISMYEPDMQVLFKPTELQDNRAYYGSIDKVLIPSFLNESNLLFYDDTEALVDVHTGSDLRFGYRVRMAGVFDTTEGIGQPFEKGSLRVLSDNHVGVDPVLLKYNTTRHTVISLGDLDDSTVIQLGEPFDTADSHYMFWADDSKVFAGVYLPNRFYEEDSTQHIDYSFIDNCIYIGELYRDMSPEQLAARFGGSSQEALTSNVWTLAGEAVKLESDTPVKLLFKEGDTYFGRYDCLKSYPTSQEDKQSIVSIYSTELESRVNLDFRYGNTMNLDDNTLVTPENFNLYNHSGYEQTNQYFTYKAIDYDRYLDQHFPNMITWSLEKTLGEDVDKWTSFPLTSTLDLDGTKGEITKVVRFNNEIFAFQESAFAQILFNSRVQIPVSDGQPIEITNGYKVDGKRYISESIGMYNKWSLGVTPYGLYFIDDHKNSIFAYNGQLVDLTNSKGMKSWMYGEGNKRRDRWNPVDYNNVRTFYDRIYGELYFTTKNDSLVYSETLGNFISFMDYGGLQGLDNVGNKLFAMPDSSHSCRLWDMWAGKYNTFFGEFKPYWMTFIANADPMNDKVFNNLEWRSVAYDETGCYLPYSTFDTMRVWHEHQDTGCTPIKDDVGIPSLLKKKFNAFRTFIPRDMKGLWSLPGLDRIRNPWTYIRLARTQENTDQMIFTDLNIDFFE